MPKSFSRTEPTLTRSAPLRQNRILERLAPPVREAVLRRGFTSLSDAQEQAIPPILAGNNVLLIAPTGTGKTESAMLPVFDELLRSGGPGFRALYITPLRSLNRDILSRLEWWGRELGITVGVRHGDTPASERRKQALSPPDLLITTPETLQALFTGKRLREHLRQVRYVIVDEIHELAGSKRGAQLSVALERIVPYAGEFQRIGLSATVGNPDAVARFLCGDRDCETVHIPVAPHLELAVRYAGEDFDAQAGYVDRCLGSHPSNLLFVNTRVTAEALGHRLFGRGDVEVHHGSLSRDVRIDAEERFKSNRIHTLICTSSMELGIDIGHVEHVFQFGSPREVSRLVQRVGRAGHRLDTVSRGTILALGFDDLLESLVIARRAKANECENIALPVNAADVMANQVAALAVEYGDISVDAIHAVLERSACFDECRSLLDEVCAQLASHRLIGFDGSMVSRRGRSRTYLTTNLSMIHDEKKVAVFDIVSRRTVGTLDESFVVGWVHTGVVFITKGQLWRVLDIEDGKILVEPAKKARGELPSWEGEQIPVPFPVAREVGRLRKTRDYAGYAVDAASRTYMDGFFARMDAEGAPLPTDDLITIEQADEGVVVNVCAGHKANEAIARVLSILISARYGTSVGMEIGAYRIFLRLPLAVDALSVAEMIQSLDPAHVEGILTLALKRTAIFKWKLVQIAKKFGAIDTDADYQRFSMHRLSELFDDTVVAREAYRELFSEYMDVGAAASVIAAVQDGSIACVTGRLSAIGREGLFSSKDLVPPPSADQAVIATLKRRLEHDRVILFCMHCRNWKSATEVGRVPEKPQCPKCGARLIAALKPYEEDLIPVVKKKQKSEEERAVEVRMLRNANIVLSSGKTAVTALAARGVGPDAASRIIAAQQDGDGFYREILKAERNYVRTHKFW
ncbi:MAG: DEAD/DEAH box helicase [Methanomicrobiales archaeon]|nr:DEAD/DEAH box helicase [Methanomicrobiales archaeon]